MDIKRLLQVTEDAKQALRIHCGSSTTDIERCEFVALKEWSVKVYFLFKCGFIQIKETFIVFNTIIRAIRTEVLAKRYMQIKPWRD
jgi:hypothetical protein